ncbi:Sporulation stage III, protein AA [Alkaliphilus metalliredigens QYMF]|uniref:Sporulation stage III, protein AA n=1 Tax=Alkaliphilus metalliredigens (strain QYMF) TaxID=293826 RepID=A6TR27_ALKMQ|nr:stage III sporulation protein AA [Alkaliphilus metalliredigens]ABR48645.1 Sporulation stage III, protein AA [Alkaliphilus metalliredigens QYMF]
MRHQNQSINFIKKELINSAVEQLQQYLCPEIREVINKIPLEFKEVMEEIRLRANQPLMVGGNGQDYFVTEQGQLERNEYLGHVVKRINIQNTLQFISNYSIYSVEDELRNGYITVEGGHRIGIVGKAVKDKTGVKTLKDFTGLNIRVAREKKGIALPLLSHLIDHNHEMLNTLIVSPPQCGKTTLLRDIIRNISRGVEEISLKGHKVGVVDERSEIAASFQGVAQNDLGPRTDVLDACPKAIGMMMLIRAMSPDVIATDEIGRHEDGMAIEEAIMAGIKLITTVHGNSLDEILGRKVIGHLIQDKIFHRIIFLSNKNGPGTIEKILDGESLSQLKMSPLLLKGVVG